MIFCGVSRYVVTGVFTTRSGIPVKGLLPRSQTVRGREQKPWVPYIFFTHQITLFAHSTLWSILQATRDFLQHFSFRQVITAQISDQAQTSHCSLTSYCPSAEPWWTVGCGISQPELWGKTYLHNPQQKSFTLRFTLQSGQAKITQSQPPSRWAVTA